MDHLGSLAYRGGSSVATLCTVVAAGIGSRCGAGHRRRRFLPGRDRGSRTPLVDKPPVLRLVLWRVQGLRARSQSSSRLVKTTDRVWSTGPPEPGVVGGDLARER